MTTIDLTKLIWRAIDESDRMPLTPKEQKLYENLQRAVVAYEDRVRLGRASTERRCMICRVPVSRCCC